MSIQFTLHGIDWAIIIGYLALVVAIGMYFGMRVKSSGEFFMANKRLPWFVCALSYMTVLISAQDIVSYSQTAYERGFVGGMMYLDDIGIVFLFLAIGLPIYYLSGVYSIPEYMEHRFGKSTRIACSVAVLLFMLALMSFNVYSIAVLMNNMFGWDILLIMMLCSAVCAVYTASGGVMSVMITDTLQAALIFIGGGAMVYMSVKNAGGLSTMMANLPTAHRSWLTPLMDPDYPALGMFLGGTLVLGFAWYFAHQSNLQKILAARTLNQARLVTLIFAFVLMPIGVLFTGFPGVVYRSLVEQGLAVAPSSTAVTFLYLVNTIAAPGILGFVLAFVLASMLSTGAGYISSCTTVFVSDIYEKWRPGKSDKHYLTVSRITAIVIAIVIPYLFAQYFMKFDALMTALISMTSATMPGMVLVIMMGMLGKKLNNKAATFTVWVSLGYVGLELFVPDIFLKPFCFGLYGTPGCSWFTAFGGLVAAIVAVIIGMLIWPKRDKKDEEYFGLVYTAQKSEALENMYWRAVSQGKKGYIELSAEERAEIARDPSVPAIK